MDERLDVRRLADYVWLYRRGLLILAAAVAAVSFGLRLVARDPYQASAQVLILSPVAETELEPRYELSMLSYLELARGEDLLRRAVQGAAGLDEESRKPGAVRFDIEPLRDTRVLVLRAQAPRASDAAAVANEAARRFIELCQEVRKQEIVDQQRLIQLDLSQIEKQLAEESRGLDELLASTGHWTREEIRDEMAQLRRLQAAEAIGAGLEPAAEGAAPRPTAEKLEARLAELGSRLEKERDRFEAIELRRWKLDQLRQAASTLLHESLTIGNTINQRLGHAVLSSEAVAPLRPVGPSAVGTAVLGGAAALALSAAILVLWALLTGEHLRRGDGAPAA
jgi:capsular polysaccharide biosynthesis protein